MNDNIQKEVITLPPFKRFCMTIGELPSSYVETMTYYEMVLWFTKYLSDTIIPTVNNNAEAVTELQNLFVELQSYVNNYFDNLDVQEEINNKLDEMAEAGTLSSIMEEFFKSSIFNNDITYNEYYDETSLTNYYISEIPFNENNLPKFGIANDNMADITSKESTIHFAIRKNATICCNAGLANLTTHLPYGVLIYNGIILQDTLSSGNTILGIKPNGDFETFDAGSTTANQVLEAGCTNALTGYYTIIENGQIATIGFADKQPRQVIGRKTNGDYFIFTCNGRYVNDPGMSVNDIQRILIARGDIDFAFMLDGGGSTSTVYKYEKINANIDNKYEDRAVSNFIYFGKDIEDHIDTKTIFAFHSYLKQLMIKKFVTFQDVYSGYLRLYSDGLYPGIDFYPQNKTVRAGKLEMNYNGLYVPHRTSDDPDEAEINLFAATNEHLYHNNRPLGDFFNYCTNDPATTDCDTITNQGFYLVTSSSQHVPQTAQPMILLHINNYSDGTGKFQLAYALSGNKSYIYTRRYTSNAWTQWIPAGINSDTTANRPTNPISGQMFFDSTLQKPIWYFNGWKDASGTSV